MIRSFIRSFKKLIKSWNQIKLSQQIGESYDSYDGLWDELTEPQVVKTAQKGATKCRNLMNKKSECLTTRVRGGVPLSNLLLSHNNPSLPQAFFGCARGHTKTNALSRSLFKKIWREKEGGKEQKCARVIHTPGNYRG